MEFLWCLLVKVMALPLDSKTTSKKKNKKFEKGPILPTKVTQEVLFHP
jgi:hypothetical protein